MTTDWSQKIEAAKHSPNDLAELRLAMAAEYSYLSGMLEATLLAKADQWGKLRASAETNAEADRLWEASETGRNEAVYRLRLKSMEKCMSAIRTLLDVKNAEARGQW